MRFQCGARRLRRLVVAIGILTAGPFHLAAQATAYVPVTDPAYRDIDALIAAGLIRSGIVGTRPYSQFIISTLVLEARSRLSRARVAADSAHVPVARMLSNARLLEAIDRLERRFATGRDLTSHGARVDIVSADSPLRRAHSALGGGIEADIAPLLQRNQGRVIPDGSSIALEAWADRQVGSRFALAIQPRVVLASPRGAGFSASAELVSGYVRGLFGNIAIDIGRNTLTRGTSGEMSPTLSTNSRGFDMLRVSSESPTRLPWVFRGLGPAKFAGSISALGDNRSNPGGVLIAWEGSIRPISTLELGITLVAQQGGKGSPDATLGQRVLDALFISRRALGLTHFLWVDPGVSDKFFGADARWTIPALGSDFYLEFGTTDDDDLFFVHPTKSLWNEAAWLVGYRQHALATDGRLDLWIEAAHNGVDVYRHNQFTSGLTEDRRVFGSPLGPLASAIRGGAQYVLPRGVIAMNGAWEQYSGDTWTGTSLKSAYAPSVDNPEETRARATIDWIQDHRTSGLFRTTLRAGVERVVNFNFTSQSRTNFLAQAGIEWVW